MYYEMCINLSDIKKPLLFRGVVNHSLPAIVKGNETFFYSF
jgi:hypothetical protein